MPVGLFLIFRMNVELHLLRAKLLVMRSGLLAVMHVLTLVLLGRVKRIWAWVVVIALLLGRTR